MSLRAPSDGFEKNGVQGAKCCEVDVTRQIKSWDGCKKGDTWYAEHPARLLEEAFVSLGMGIYNEPVWMNTVTEGPPLDC
jgi:hypothetical protein